MVRKDVFWMACDSTEALRAEYGPFHTREEAEAEARRMRFGYLLRYEHILNPENEDEIQEVHCVFIELPDIELPDSESQDKELPDSAEQANGSHYEPLAVRQNGTRPGVTFHTRCASCGEAAAHDQPWLAEVWADIHEFENTRHKVRLFEHARGEGLKEICDWRNFAA